MTKDEALKLALEVLQFSGNIWHMDCKKDEAITAIEEALARPEQEVSCRFCHDKRGCWAWQCYHCGEFDDVQQPTPPAEQRTWVSLTDDQIKEIVGPWGDTPIKGYTRKLIDQIDAKLRENNNG
jgi:hypothetical protein